MLPAGVPTIRRLSEDASPVVLGVSRRNSLNLVGLHAGVSGRAFAEDDSKTASIST